MLFRRYVLRTTDLEAAATFYGRLLGWQVRWQTDGGVFVDAATSLQAEPPRMAELEPLPERARSQGAPAHWLGLLAASDVPMDTQRWLQAGAQARGPLQQGERGLLQALRDPQGAAMGLCSSADTPSLGVAWHQLHVPDADLARSTYAALAGFFPGEDLDLGPPWGWYRGFRGAVDGPPLGAMLSNSATPHIHTQWLFFLPTQDIESALRRVCTLGGRVVSGPLALTSTLRALVCEDPQGAAFALCEPLTDSQQSET